MVGSSLSSSQPFPKSTGHTRRSQGDWSHSTGFFTSSTSRENPSTAFSRTGMTTSSRMSSSSFAVTSVGVPTLPPPRELQVPSTVHSRNNSTDDDEHDDGDDHDDGDGADVGQSTATGRMQQPPSSRPGLGAKQFSEDDLILSELLEQDDSPEKKELERKRQKLRIAQRETRQLCLLRGVTLVIFILAASLVSVLVHQSLTEYQDEQWELLYEQQAQNMIQQWQDRLSNQLLPGLEEWQYQYQYQYHQYFNSNENGDEINNNNDLTITTQFVERADLWLRSTQTSFFGMAPMVPSSNRTEWERYSRAMAHTWIITSSSSRPVKIDPASIPTEITPTTTNLDYIAPLWQHAPFNSDWINQDLLQQQLSTSSDSSSSSSSSNLSQEILMATTRQMQLPYYYVVLGNLLVSIDWGQDDPVSTAAFDGTSSSAASGAENVVNHASISMPPQRLQSMMYFPIPSSIDAKENDNTDENTTAAASAAAGVVMALIDWDIFLQVSMLDELAQGIVVLLTKTCPLSSSPQPGNNNNATAASTSMERYAYQVVLVENTGAPILQRVATIPSGLLTDLAYSLDIIETLSQVPLSTKGIQVQSDYCQYMLDVVPTEAMQEEQTTRHPAAFTGGIVGVFLFCGLVFLAYDCLVERRQKKVMKSAVKTHEIVASLFPETVRNRLFGEDAKSNFKANNKQTKQHDVNGGGAVDKKKNKNKNKKEKEQSLSPMPHVSDEEILSPRKPDVKGGIGALSSSERTTTTTTTTTNNNVNRPIADLFPHTSVLFADIAGFTAWSSARDPAQVFILLETIYAAFDRVAAQRSVFKVETIGDCYVAVTGLPQPQEDHALRMVKFARDCVKTMQTLVQSLEVELGPDTGDLSIRVGIHSGPVTAGVLRGQKSRFQLFGDTVNFASRMESNGLPNQIQCSQQTADLLITANKNHWIHPRKDMVHAKGKGLVQTYWVIGTKPSGRPESIKSLGASNPTMTSTTSIMDSDDHSDITEEPLDNIHTRAPRPRGRSFDDVVDPLDVSPHLQRLIDWNVDMLAKIIKTILATRYNRKSMNLNDSSRLLMSDSVTLGVTPTLIINSNPRNEYCEAIQLPHYDPGRLVKRGSMSTGLEDLDEAVKNQLRDYITTIACAYNDHPFHNFEHASHVTMSANKLLKRVVNAEHVQCRRSSLDNLASKLHHYTYGITSDPLTHFACLFSALIHDVDHPGISNAQMLKEKHPLAEVYEGKSIAEQNSFDFAWELLMDSEFDTLRRCLFENEQDLHRFRQLVINSIMATDVFDPDLVKLRNERWRKAFPESVDSYTDNNDGDAAVQAPPSPPPTSSAISSDNHLDLKATVVIEQIIQAADVAHTMQHWHVYQKWNRRLFAEMHASYCAGKSPVNPAESWYKGELWFYDNYIIPLASKLRECRVFGASSDEFLTYAMDNRSEWEAKGQAIVQDMVAACTHQSEEFLLTQIANETKEKRKSQTG